ncbi:hypothetical protein chiPu_0024840, partial [Chiloscyllium punctatum]|nr:hypothetical protein [Chiloscyllium punctatum]
EYYPWKGQLANKDKVISVALKSNGSPLMPVVLGQCCRSGTRLGHTLMNRLGIS